MGIPLVGATLFGNADALTVAAANGVGEYPFPGGGWFYWIGGLSTRLNVALADATISESVMYPAVAGNVVIELGDELAASQFRQSPGPGLPTVWLDLRADPFGAFFPPIPAGTVGLYYPLQLIRVVGTQLHCTSSIPSPVGDIIVPAGSSVILSGMDALPTTSPFPSADRGRTTGVAGTTPDTLDMAAYLEGITTACGNPSVATTGGSATTITCAGPAFTRFDSLIGARVTMLTGTAANVGCSATVESAAAGVVITLTDFRDATGVSIPQLPAAVGGGDTFSLELDFANDLITAMRGPGADRTTLISGFFQLWEKILGGTAAPFDLSMNQIQEVAPTALGTTAMLSLPYDDTAGTGDTTITINIDEAAGYNQIPRAGRLRVVDYHTGVGSSKNQGGAKAGADRPYIPYRRAKRSNVLDLGATNLLGSDFGVGCVVEFDSRTTGLAVNKGWEPEIKSTQATDMVLFKTADIEGTPVPLPTGYVILT